MYKSIFLNLCCSYPRLFNKTEALYVLIYKKYIFLVHMKGLAYQGHIRDLLEKADKTLYKKRSNDPECPFFQFLPTENNTRYNLRDTSVSVPRIYTDRFKNVFSNRIIFR